MRDNTSFCYDNTSLDHFSHQSLTEAHFDQGCIFFGAEYQGTEENEGKAEIRERAEGAENKVRAENRG